MQLHSLHEMFHLPKKKQSLLVIKCKSYGVSHFFFFFWGGGGLHPQHMEVLGPKTESELQLQHTYATAVTMPNP